MRRDHRSFGNASGHDRPGRCRLRHHGLLLRCAIMRNYDVGGLCTCILGGLVSITLGCGNMECGSAVAIGTNVEPSHLDEACELDAGDNGPRGAVPTTEYLHDYLQFARLELDCVQHYGGLAISNPALPWQSLDDAVDDSAGKLTGMTHVKLSQGGHGLKLQVHPPGTSAGTRNTQRCMPRCERKAWPMITNMTSAP